METFKDNGSYNKTEWKNGDIITADKLNKIEDALYEINDDNNNFATKDEIPVVPTNVSAFTNDARYVTQYHTHDDYASKTYVDNAIADIDIPKVDLSNYVTKSEVPMVPTKMSDLTNDAGYVTQYHSHDNYVSKTYVDDAIAGIDVPEVDLSNYVTKSEIPTVPTKTSDLTNDSNFITSIPSEYITETELSNKNYADKSYVTNAINNAQLGGSDGSTIDLSIYATKDDLANIADTIDIPTKTSQLDNDSGFLISIPLEYVTESELTAKDYATKSYVDNAQIDVDLSDYALKTDIPTVPTNISAFTNDSGYALRTDIPTVPTNVSAFNNDSGYIISNNIIRVEIVTAYPPEEEQEQGVLYIKVSE